MNWLTSRKFSRLETILIAAAAAGLVTTLAWAVSVPNTFTSGTPALASEVNQNFTALAGAVTTLENQNLDSRLSTVEAAIAALQAQIGSDANGAENLETAVTNLQASLSNVSSGLSALETQVGTDANDTEDLETAVATLQSAGGGASNVMWKDATGRVIGPGDGTGNAASLVWHMDSDGYTWGVDWNGVVTDLSYGFPDTLYYTTGDCSGQAYLAPQWLIGDPLAARRPFLVVGDAAYHVYPDNPTLQNLSINSYDSGSGCASDTQTYDFVSLSETIPPAPITKPADFILPFHLERTP